MTTVVLEPRNITTSPAAQAAGLDRLLGEFELLLLQIPSAVFETVPEGGVPIRRHVDRALDLIEGLIAGGATSRMEGLERVRTLREAAVAWQPSLDAVVRLEPMAGAVIDEESWSTVAVELAFAVNRVVDIQKLIEAQMRSCGFRVPEGFGSMELQPLRARSSQPPSLALWHLLNEIESLIGDLSEQTYCARFDAHVSGSIGEHVRHCLDHVAALLTADRLAPLSYDRRCRGTAVETDPGEALIQIAGLKSACAAWSTRSLDDPIRVVSLISSSGETVTGWSTLARELAFVVSHTIHHQAIIGVLLAVHGHAVPQRFGHSPSTPRRH